MGALRQFMASIFEQIFYYIALLLSFFVWLYSSSFYLTIAAFIVLVLLAWYLSSKIEGKPKSDNKSKQ